MAASPGTRLPRHASLWSTTAEMPKYLPLRKHVRADVCVIGGGIAGLTTAYLLTEAGKTVVVIEDGPLAGGMTQFTTAHLANAIDARYVEIERLHGALGARLAADSHTAAIDRIEAIVQREEIACDFERVDGYLFLPSDAQHTGLDQECATAWRAGLTAVEPVARVPWKTFATGPALRFPRQGQFHPLRYLAGVANAIERRGGAIYTGTHADRIESGPPAQVHAGEYTITADAVVVATNTPINDLFAIHTKQMAYMTYVIGARISGGAIPTALYWDTEDPYHYVRLYPQRAKGGPEGSLPPIASHEEGDVLMVGGEDRKTGQRVDPNEPYTRLEQWARERFPMMGEVQFVWGGEVMESHDGLAFIGRNPLDKPNVFVATGDSGMGMTHGTIAGILLTDLIVGRENPWTALYDPSRLMLHSAGAYTADLAHSHRPAVISP